jgi:gelsolin
LPRKEQNTQGESSKPDLYRLTVSDNGAIDFESIPLTPVSSLDTNDAYLLDDSSQPIHPAIYVWLGKASSTGEKRIALQYGQNFLHKKNSAEDEKKIHIAITLVKMNEGQETAAFTKALEQDI